MDISYLLNQIKTDKIFLFKSFYRWFYFGIMIAGLVLVLSGVDFYFNKSPSTDSWELIVLNSIVVVAGMLTGRVVLFLLGNLIGMALFSWLFTRHKYEQNIRIFSVVASVLAIIILKYSLIDKYSLVFTYPFVIVLIILIDLLVIWPRTTHHFSYRRKPGYLARLRSRSIYLAGISLVLSGIDLNFNKSVSINFG